MILKVQTSMPISDKKKQYSKWPGDVVENNNVQCASRINISDIYVSETLSFHC